MQRSIMLVAWVLTLTTLPVMSLRVDDVATCPRKPFISKPFGAGWSKYKLPDTDLTKALANSDAKKFVGKDINVAASLIAPCFYRTKTFDGGTHIEVTFVAEGGYTCIANLFRRPGTTAAFSDSNCYDVEAYTGKSSVPATCPRMPLLSGPMGAGWSDYARPGTFVKNAIHNSGSAAGVAIIANSEAQYVEPCFYRARMVKGGKEIEVTVEVDGGYTCTVSLFKPRGEFSIYQNAKCKQMHARRGRLPAWRSDEVVATCPEMPFMSPGGWSRYQVPDTLMREALANSGATQIVGSDMNIDEDLIQPCFFRTKRLENGANIEVTLKPGDEFPCKVNLFKPHKAIAIFYNSDCKRF